MPFTHRVRIFLFAFAYLSILAAEARANSVTIYDDRNAFIAASTLTSTVTFEGLTPPGTAISYGSFGSAGSVTVSDVTFTTAPSVLLEIVNAPGVFGWDTGSISGGTVLDVFPLFGEPAVLNISLPGTFTAIGFDTSASLNAVVGVTLSDGTQLAYTVPEDPILEPVGRFFGFTTTTGITSLRLSGNIDDGPRSRSMIIDDLRFGQVPEPSSFILINAGLIGLAVKARRRLS